MAKVIAVVIPQMKLSYYAGELRRDLIPPEIKETQIIGCVSIEDLTLEDSEGIAHSYYRVNTDKYNRDIIGVPVIAIEEGDQ